MGLFSLFWDMRQDQEIREAKSTADRSSRRALSTHEMLQELRDAVDRLSLMNQALWELLRDRAELTDADLRAAESRARCLYCGESLREPGAR